MRAMFTMLTGMREIKFQTGRKYIKAYTEDSDGGRNAVAFKDITTGLWYEAASWSQPSHRLALHASEMDLQLDGGNGLS